MNYEKRFKATKYGTVEEMRRKIQRSESAIFFRQTVVVLLVLFLFIIDCATLKPVFEAILTEDKTIVYLLSMGAATILNILPLILGKAINEYRYGFVKSKVMILTPIITFLVAWAVLAIFRYETRDLSFNDAASSMIGLNPTWREDHADTGAQMSLAVWLACSPLFTSVISTLLGFISADPVKKRMNKLELTILKLYAKRADCYAEKTDLAQRIEQQEQLLEMCYEAALKSVDATIQSLEAIAVDLLVEAIGTGEAVNVLIDNELKQGGEII